MAKTVYSDGNQQTGVPGTRVTAAQLNALLNPEFDGQDIDGHNAAFRKGADIASAAALVFDTANGNRFGVTGAVNITSMPNLGGGTHVVLEFAAALIIYHDAATGNIKCPGGQNLPVVPGEKYLFIEYAAGKWELASTSTQVVTGIVNGTQLGQYNLPANTTNTSPIITLSGTDLLRAGMTVTGTGIPANTTISSITDTVTAVLSNAATVTTSGLNNANTLVFTSVPAPSGLVGETYHWSGITTAVATTATELRAFSLPAGKWDVLAFVLSYDNVGYGSSNTSLASWIGAISGVYTGTTRGRDRAHVKGYTGAGNDSSTTPLRRIISISGTTTFYLGAYYSTTTGSVDWSITAVRIK
jgi:hypothetical protein